MPETNDSIVILKEINQKLDNLQKLIILALKGDSTDSDMVKALHKINFKPAEIGRLLGIKTNQVTSRIAIAKKSKKKADDGKKRN